MSTVEPLIEAEDSVPDGDLDGAAEVAPDLPEGRFSNRELSWLKYSERVLAQGEDVALPLLERMKFLAIFATNLDEFYMVRVAGLKRRADMGLQVPSPDGLSPREVLAALAERTAASSTGMPVASATTWRRPSTVRASISAAGATSTTRSSRASAGTSATRSSRC